MYSSLYGNTSRRMDQSESNIHETNLSWSMLRSDILLSGDTQINQLKNIKNIVLAIRRQFSTSSDPQISLNPVRRDDLDKRMILLQSEVQGLMKRKINFNIKDENGQRTLDYTNILNEKQNQIVQLEKKIQNLQHRLRKSTSRENELQNKILSLYNEVNIKQQIIQSKNQIILAEVNTSNALFTSLNQIRRNVDFNRHRIQDLEKIVFNEVNIPDSGSFDVRADQLTRINALSRSTGYQQLNSSQQIRTRMVELFRQVERMLSQNAQIKEADIQKVLEGFLLNQKQGRIFEKYMTTVKRAGLEQRYEKLRQNFAIAAGIYKQNLNKLQKDNPQIRINLQHNLFEILQREQVQAYKIQNGAIFVDSYTERTVQVPVQDARTKHLIHLLASEMKKFTIKYPQLLKQMDNKLCEFFQQQIIDLIDVDEFDKLVNIVKYVPQVVKVQNVYAYSSEKTRKVEFHLRILLKALLEEFQKLKQKNNGLTLQMDEGIISMINAQIMSTVNVDDILKVFRPVPKIVQVEKIVEKIVQRRVEVPMVIPITKQIQKIVEVEKFIEVQKIVYVPLQIPEVRIQYIQKIVPIQQIIERVVEVPQIVERIVYVNVQVPKIREVQVIVEKFIEVEKIIQVERVVNHIQQQPQEIIIEIERIVPVQTIIEKIVEVPVYRDKIIQKIVEVPKIIEIKVREQKLVPVVEHRKALQVINHIQTIHKPIQRIVEKIVVVQKIVERIVQVPQIVEKIKEVRTHTVEIRQIQVIREKLIIQEVIKQIEVIVKQIIQVPRQIIKQVQRIVEIPLIREIIKLVQTIVQKPIIQRVQNTIVKEVYIKSEPIIIEKPKIIEVEKIIRHYIEVPKPIKYYEQKIVEIPRNVDRIKQVRVEIEKIIEKMVEVPKVIEVERIVQKIVVVPRVVQKVIEVPQIVQKIVQRQVQKIVIRQVQVRVEIPVIQEQPFEVKTTETVYVEVPTIQKVDVERVVVNNRVEDRIITHQVTRQHVVELLRQVPVSLTVETIVPAYYETVRPVQIIKTQIVPLQIPVPVEVHIQKVVPIREIVEKIIQVPQFIQKIVEIKQQQLRIQYINQIVQKIVVDERIKQVQRIVPYINDVIKQIPTIIQKLVTIQTKVQQIKTAQQIIQKIVQRSTIVPRIHQIQKIVPKLIKVPEIIEVEKIVPQIIRVNQYVQRIVQKIIEVPRIIQKIKQIQKQKQKIVQIQNVRTQIVEVQRLVQQVVIHEQIREVIKHVNHVVQAISIVDRIQRIPMDIPYRQQILVEIPRIIQKIVEKIIVMPQIVEVLKYVHEISESTDLVTVENEKQFKEQQFKLIQVTKNLKPAISGLLGELKSLKSTNQFGGRIETIENFVTELQKLIAFPKLIRIQGQQRVQTKLIQKQIVKVPVQDEAALRKQLSMSILVQKLVMQIKRLLKQSRLGLELDDEIKMIFFAELQTSNRFSTDSDIKDKFVQFAAQVQRQFQSLGPWAEEQALMLNTILEERFKMAQIIEAANLEIERAKAQYNNIAMLLQQQSRASKHCYENLNKLKTIFRSYSTQKQSQLSQISTFIEQAQRNQPQGRSLSMTRLLREDDYATMTVYQSKLRQQQATIYKLQSMLHDSRRILSSSRIQPDQQRQIIKYQQKNDQLQHQYDVLKQSALIRDTHRQSEFGMPSTPVRREVDSLSQSEIRKVDLSPSQYSISGLNQSPAVRLGDQTSSHRGQTIKYGSPQSTLGLTQSMRRPEDQNSARIDQQNFQSPQQGSSYHYGQSPIFQAQQGQRLFTTPESDRNQVEKEKKQKQEQQKANQPKRPPYNYYFQSDKGQ